MNCIEKKKLASTSSPKPNLRKCTNEVIQIHMNLQKHKIVVNCHETELRLTVFLNNHDMNGI